MLVVDVLYPGIGGHILGSEHVENLDIHAGVLDAAHEFGLVAHAVATLLQKHEGESEVHATVPLGVANSLEAFGFFKSYRQTAGEYEVEVCPELRESRDVVLEEQVESHPLVGRSRYVPRLDTVAVFVVIEIVLDILLGVHDGNCEPRLQPADELAADLQVKPRGIPDGVVIATVCDAHVVDGVGDEMVQVLVVGLRRELERSAP